MCKIHLTKMKRTWRSLLCLAGFILGALILPGCDKVQITQIPASKIPLMLTSTPTRETPQPTASPVGTVTALPEATWTPVLALPLEVRMQNLNELFSTNGGCDFPCWWGLLPGDPIQKVAELSPLVGKSPRLDGQYYYYSLSLDELNAPDLNINYYVSNQVVQRMEISLVGISRLRDYYDSFETRLSLASLLGRYGKPSEVLFLVTPRFEPGETPRPYTLFLVYDTQDFGIVYSGLVDYEDPLQVCSIKLDDHHLQHIMLYMKNPRLNITEMGRSNSTELRPLEEVTPMSLDDFYQTFSDPGNDQCIEVSTDVWQ